MTNIIRQMRQQFTSPTRAHKHTHKLSRKTITFFFNYLGGLPAFLPNSICESPGLDAHVQAHIKDVQLQSSVAGLVEVVGNHLNVAGHLGLDVTFGLGRPGDNDALLGHRNGEAGAGALALP